MATFWTGPLDARGQHAQPAHTRELVTVAGDHAEAVRERCCRDPKVVRSDGPAATAQISPGFRMDARDGLRDRHGFEACKDVLDERPAARSARTRCPVDTVEQLADRHDADRVILVADERFQGCR